MTRAREIAAAVPRSWLHPAALVASGGGIGLMPVAPGSWASLAALPCGWLIAAAAGPIALTAAAVAAFCAGCWASGRIARHGGDPDPGWIVIDEIAGQWLVLLAAPPGLAGLAAAFLLFRLFDIAKPWPIRALERRVAGGLGIMLDDVAAAIYAGSVMLIGEGVARVLF